MYFLLFSLKTFKVFLESEYMQFGGLFSKIEILGKFIEIL